MISHEAPERYLSLRDAITKKARGLIKNNAQQQATREEFYALRDINFEVERGDRVGIIGRNGAGKSTLLKILSRITEPSSGRITIRGRVASLLEVGTGFHPELTGRENIFLNGAILGMNRGEIRNKFDEIVDFAEIEKFLDTPVKRYSSGMYVRLAFAVAAHLEPEILVVDEVLAVGDAEFQKKCLGKMGAVSKEGGRTVLFVSHNIDSIGRLCNKGILLHQGQIVSNGIIDDVITSYQSRNNELNSTFTKANGIIRSVQVTVNKTANKDFLEDVLVEADLVLMDDIPKPVFGVVIKDIHDNSIVALNNKHYMSNDFVMSRGEYKVSMSFPELPLANNSYKADIFFGTGIVDIDFVVDKIFFNINNPRKSQYNHPVDLKLNKIYVEKIGFKIQGINQPVQP